MSPQNDLDVIVVGAGFSGLYMVHKMRGIREANRDKSAGFGGSLPDIETVDATALTPEQQRFVLEEFWKAGGLFFIGAFADLLSDPNANGIASDFVRDKVREVVKDPESAALLAPDHGVACKRPCADTGCFETYTATMSI